MGPIQFIKFLLSGARVTKPTFTTAHPFEWTLPRLSYMHVQRIALAVV